MNRDNMNRGRPIGTTKDPNRRRVQNNNGRLIDYGGLQYNRLIQSGYMLNTEGNSLVADPNFTAAINTRRPVGRPSGPARVVPNEEKVKNPDTKRMINKSGVVFRKLANKYPFNEIRNRFTTKVIDPKTETPIKLQSPKFLRKIDRGYIYDRNENSLIIPSVKTEEALEKGVTEFDLSIVNESDPDIQLSKLVNRVAELCKRNIKSHSIKLNISMDIMMSKVNGDNVPISQVFHIRNQATTIHNNGEISGKMRRANARLMQRIDRFTNVGSGWTVDEIQRHFLTITRHRPLSARSYIPLPSWIQNKKATINIKNNDDKCFIYCLARVLDPNPEKRDLERVSKHLKQVCIDLKLLDIKVPVSMKDIPRIEKNYNISINVYGHDKSSFSVIRSTDKKYDNHIDLLYTEDNNKNHYVWIKDFNKLNFGITKYAHKKHFCKHCLQHFTTEKICSEHSERCFEVNGAQAIQMPKEGSTIEFKNLKNTIACPFVIYADLEAILEPIKSPTDIPNNNTSYTTKTQKHECCSFGYKIVCRDNNKYSKPYKSFRGKDAISKFFEALLEDEKEILKHMQEFKRPDIKWKNSSQKEEYKKATSCYICKESFTAENKKVRDHNHVSGYYRGPACNRCNLELTISNKIPIIFHNLKGYDSHHIIKAVGNFSKKISVIPLNMEKYVSFSIGTERNEWDKKVKKTVTKTRNNLTFIDSFQFMSSSLSQLVDDLKKSGVDNFKYTKQEFNDMIDVITRKGVYPYSYISSFSKFDKRITNLKPKHFKNDLTGEEISESDYKFFLDVCDQFNITTIGEYHDLYLKTDVLLLADVFENFRRTCLEYYELDPVQYISAPGLSWDACLKMTGIKLDLISDVDMHLMIEKGLRGGVSIVTNRKGVANNKYMNNFVKSKPSTYMAYFDANNLYGWGMYQSMPYGRFKWKNPETYTLPSYTELCSNTLEKGHILEVDLKYPKKLHDLHNELPYCPEHVNVSSNMLSEYTKNVAKKYDIKCGNYTKLIPTLDNKYNYVIHERNLRQAVDAGLKVTKIHKVLQFDQKPWIKDYIEFNTNKRKQAKNDFEKNFFKLMNNSFFGKTMEDKRKRVNVKLVTSTKMLDKYASKPTYVCSKIFDENLVAVHNMQDKIVLDKPIYVGFSILDISKTLMYDFHYNFIKQEYPESDSILHYMDTDSLIYTITTKDIYKDMYKNKEYFDLSDISIDKLIKYKDDSNKKVIGKMKMEYINSPISEFIGLKSKMYSVKFDSGEESKRAKGIAYSVTKNDLRHEMYNNTLETKGRMYSRMNAIRSIKHQLYTITMNKISLSAYDDKRYILNDGITSHAYGHYKLE